MTLLSQILDSVSAEERQQISVAIARSGAPLTYSRWVRSPLEAFEEEREEAWPGARVLTPGPWIELLRISSPDGDIDAVLVERQGPPYGNSRHPDIRQSNLFLVPTGSPIKDLAPYQFKDFEAVREREWENSVYIVFDIAEVDVKWKDSSTVILRSVGPRVEVLKKPEKVVDTLGIQRKLKIEYVDGGN